jgi:hypothetical protein
VKEAKEINNRERRKTKDVKDETKGSKIKKDKMKRGL